MGNRAATPNETAPPTSSDREPAASKGAILGEYEVVEHLGTGGFGHVYSVVHTIIGKRAALKVLYAEHSRNKTQSSRFVTEAKAVNKIGHPGIVDVFAIGELPDGRKFLAMELLDGESLGDVLRRRGRLPASDVLSILRPIAEALDAAHAAGIVHRDLKPDNVYMNTHPVQGVRPKLLDFGIAKLRAETPEIQTQTGQALGTPLYMAPEQWRGRSVDHRADIYSLGVMAYELATGYFPFRGDSLGDIMINVCTTDPTPATRYATHLPSVVDAAFARLLARAPTDRPNSASEAIALLGSSFEGAEQPAPMACRQPTDDVPTRVAHMESTAAHVVRVSAATPVIGAGETSQASELSQGNDVFSPPLSPQDGGAAGRGRVIALAVLGVGAVAALGYFALMSQNEDNRTTASSVDPSGPAPSASPAQPVVSLSSTPSPSQSTATQPSATQPSALQPSQPLTRPSATRVPTTRATATPTNEPHSLTPTPTVALPVTER